MTTTIETSNTSISRPQNLSRRQMMIGAAGLTFALALARLDDASAATPTAEIAGKSLSPWVSIATDGTISIMSPATEMGQGSTTSLPLIIAEELDADWSKVRIVAAPPIEALYGNPGFAGQMYTAGSNAVTSYFRPLRTFGAQVRRVLLDNAARKLGVPIEELTTEPSVVVHAKSGRKLGYGDIAAFADVPAKAPEVKPESLKKPSEFRLISKDVMRVELPNKVNGSAKYAIDVQVPGMIYGVVLRSPVEGGGPDRVDESKLKAIDGVIRIVGLPYGVGVLAESAWAALAARRALDGAVTWTRTGMGWGFDSDAGMEAFAAAASNLKAPATDWDRQGNAPDEMTKAATVLEATYRCDYAYHAQMEPLNAIASVSPAGDAVELWCGTQSQSLAVEATAKVLGIPRDKVKLNYYLMGGGFGRRGHRDEEFIVDAVLLAKEAGKPVKVLWTREDDVRNGRFRPITAHHLRAGLDATGKLVAWHHRVAGDRVTPYMDSVRFQQAGGKDNILMRGVELRSYDIPHQATDQLYRDTGVRTSPLRGIGFTANKFVTEAFLDEIAARRGIDPVALRLELLKNTPRGRKVVERVAEIADWGQEARRSRPRLCIHRLFRHADGRHRRSVYRPKQRTDPRPQFLVHARLRHPGAAGQRGGADREQHRVWTRNGVERAHHHQGWRSRAVQFLRLPGAAHERGADDAYRGHCDGQSSDRRRTDGHSASSSSNLGRYCPTHRSTPAPHAVHP